MYKVNVSIATAPAELPAGITAGKLRLTINDVNGSVVFTQDVDGTTAEFTGVSPADYVMSVARVDSNGAIIGGVITQAFSVTVAPVVMFDAPQAITITSTLE